MIKTNRDLIAKISKQNGLGSLNTSAANALGGFNHRGVGVTTKSNIDSRGLTFFTRPDLNLSYDNIQQSRILSSMLVENEITLPRALRCILDPRGWRRGVKTPLIDNKSPFIPLLTNTLLSISGWDDPKVDTYTSPEGRWKEQYSLIDDHPVDYSVGDVTATFSNIEGNVINHLFRYWLNYATMVLRGGMTPYPDNILENRVDYNTRIYRLVLDSSRRYVQAIAQCGAAFPTTTNTGATFNYSSDSASATDTGQISIPFRIMGREYDDPIIIEEFNAVQALFNPAMRTEESRRGAGYVKLTQNELDLFNYEGYPFIAEDNELQWWVPPEEYRNSIAEMEELLGGSFNVRNI